MLDSCWNIGGLGVNLVYYRNYLESGVEGFKEVGDGLGLYALGAVDNQEGSFAGTDAATYLVAEVNVARGVNKVEYVLLFNFCFLAVLS